jgi:GNAT superfamily N-acetyltransferase
VVASIRNATLADLASLETIFRRSSLWNEGDRDALLSHSDALDFSDLPVRQGRTRVADDIEGCVIGFITTDILDDVLEIEDLFVDPKRMRHGVGRTLVHDAVARARHHAVARIEVTANPHALDFYKAVGFIVDSMVETRFAPGFRMHLDVRPKAIDPGSCCWHVPV